MKRIPPKTILITGAASGIGEATARRAAQQGHRVVLADIDDARARRIAGEIGASASAERLDICAEEQWEQVLARVWERHGGLDVLVNNAAIVHTGFARDVSVAKHRHTMETNFLGAVTGMLTALPRFRAQGSGHLVTVASMTAFIPYPGLASYAAAKHALRAFHHALAIEERDAPIDFTIIYPTATETPMLEKEAEDDALALAFAGTPWEVGTVATQILDAIRRKSVELYMPAERGKIVRRLGTSPRLLREMVEKNEAVGAAKLKARRAAKRSPVG